MSTLKVNKLRDTAGSADAITLDPNGGAVLAGVTTISTARITTGITTSIQVGGGVTISESGIDASGIGITCANINGGAIGGRKNLVINGDMRIAQRHTSSTTHPAYAVDRFRWGFNNHSAGTVTASQQSLSSSDTPYTLGFRKYNRLALGQAGTAAANTAINLTYKFEAQDVANSGWNYTSTSSFITISFWFRCSTNQTFVGEFQSKDGTAQAFTFTFTASGNNAWTKIIKTVPGASNVQIDDDNGGGFDFRWYPFYGTDYSTSGHTLEQWGAYSGSDIVPDMASTWLTAGASTFDITGFQLEVGSQATPFEHRSFGEELSLCQRYFYKITGNNDDMAAIGFAASSSDNYFNIEFPVPMRDYPTLTGSATAARFYSANVGQDFNLNSLSLSSNMTNANPKRIMLYVNQGGTSGGYGGVLHFQEASGFLEFSAEL